MEWISVKDRLPELGVDVLVSYYDGVNVWVTVGKLNKDYDWLDLTCCDDVDGCYIINDYITHWMPLPKPPKQ